MDLELNEEQQALRETVRELFEKESPSTVVRAAEPLGFDASLWQKVVEMGLPSIAADADRGGGGAGVLELAVVADEVGRHLAPVPFAESAAATTLLASLPSSAELDPIVARVVDGDAIATVALHPVRDGLARVVPAGAVADVVVALRDEQLVVIESVPGEPLGSLGSMPVAHRTVGSGDGIVVAEGAEALAAHRRALRHWQLLTAVSLVGLGGRAQEIALEYVQERRAFGVLIANFQTIQHHLADNAAVLEGARLLAYEAAWADDVGLDHADELALMSFLFAAETGFKAASDSLHFHGGYGFTIEYDIQLYLRRAKAWPLIAGDPRSLYVELGHVVADRTEV